MMLLTLFLSLAVAMQYDSGGTSATKTYEAGILASGAVSAAGSKLEQEGEGSSSGSRAVLDERRAPPTERKFGKNGFESTERGL